MLSRAVNTLLLSPRCKHWFLHEDINTFTTKINLNHI